MSTLERIAQGAALKRADDDTLVMFFSSRLAPAMRDFDGIGFSLRQPQSYLLLRDDTAESYYHCGVAGLGSDIPSTCDALFQICADLRPKRLVMVGSSMGGFAAGAFGYLLGADLIIALNGLSYISREVDQNRGGQRVPGSFQHVENLFAARGQAPEYVDLKAMADAAPDPVPHVRWYYGTHDKIDITHAQHIADAPNVAAIPFEGVTQHAMMAPRVISSGRLSREIAGHFEPLDGDTLSGMPNPPAPANTDANRDTGT